MTARQTHGRLVHRGHVAAVGFYYDSRPEVFAREDIMARYVPGTRVYRHKQQLLVLFPEPRRTSVDECVATPLVKQGQTLTALPLREEVTTSAALGLSLAYAGAIELSELLPEHEEDPSSWLQLENYRIESGRSLHRPAAPPEMAIQSGPQDIKKLLGGVVGDAPPEQSALIRALGEAGRSRRNSRDVGANAASSLRTGLAQAVSGLGSFFASLFSQTSAAPRQLPGRVSERSTARQAPSLWSRISRGLKLLAWKSQLGKWLGREHAKYLGELFELLDGGSYDEALRRAIPAHQQGDAGTDVPLLPFRPRKALQLGEASGGGGTLRLGEDVFSQLRRAYRQAFNDLKRRERHHEAAFVLSELLQENEEAVAYLEQNGLIQQAAQLAEARGLSSGLLVRLWFRAGERDRAIAIARRDGAFEDAVTRLKSFPDEQKALRLLWAEHLAAAGNYAGALEVAMVVEEAEALCERWTSLAIEQGGTAGARALVSMCHLRNSHFDAIRGEAIALLGNQDRFDSAALQEMASRLLSGPVPTRAARALARCLLRALLRDRGLGLNAINSTTFHRLAQLSDDGALVADLPDISAQAQLARLTSREEPLRVELAWSDTGRTPIADGAFLPKGRYLLAKGEGGVFLYSRDQKLLHHFDVPCERLVTSDQGDRVLAVAGRGEMFTVSQIHVTTRRAQHWRDVALSQFAPTFDGSTWYVAKGSFVHALDLQSMKEQSLWRSGDTEANILAISRASNRLLFATDNGECWEHESSPHCLRRRSQSLGTPVLGGHSYDFWLGAGETGTAEASELGRPQQDTSDRPTSPIAFGLFEAAGRRSLDLGNSNQIGVPRIQDSDTNWIVLSYSWGLTKAVVVLIDRLELRICLEIHLHDSQSPSARLGEQVLLVVDDRGRVMGFELGAGSQLISHRI